MEALHSFHGWWGYVAVVANGLVGIAALAAHQWRRLRGRWLWIATIVAEAMLMVQVLAGVGLVASDDYTVEDIHMFYGFLAFATVGLAYGYRSSMRGRTQLLYGLVGLFLMGLGIRAITQVT